MCVWGGLDAANRLNAASCSPAPRGAWRVPEPGSCRSLAAAAGGGRRWREEEEKRGGGGSVAAPAARQRPAAAASPALCGGLSAVPEAAAWRPQSPPRLARLGLSLPLPPRRGSGSPCGSDVTHPGASRLGYPPPAAPFSSEPPSWRAGEGGGGRPPSPRPGRGDPGAAGGARLGSAGRCGELAGGVWGRAVGHLGGRRAGGGELLLKSGGCVCVKVVVSGVGRCGDMW